MPYPRVQPVDEREILLPASLEEMEFARWRGHHSICETLREIYRETEDENIKLKTRLAMAMAKRMVKKLKEYKRGKK